MTNKIPIFEYKPRNSFTAKANALRSINTKNILRDAWFVANVIAAFVGWIAILYGIVQLIF